MALAHGCHVGVAVAPFASLQQKGRKLIKITGRAHAPPTTSCCNQKTIFERPPVQPSPSAYTIISITVITTIITSTIIHHDHPRIWCGGGYGDGGRGGGDGDVDDGNAMIILVVIVTIEGGTHEHFLWCMRRAQLLSRGGWRPGPSAGYSVAPSPFSDFCRFLVLKWRAATEALEEGICDFQA